MEITLHGTIFLGRKLRPLSIKMTTSDPSLNRVGPRWHYTLRGIEEENLAATKCPVASVLGTGRP